LHLLKQAGGAWARMREPVPANNGQPRHPTCHWNGLINRITRPGCRERFADAMLFALENQDCLLLLVRSAKSRSNAVKALISRCLLSQSEANAVLDLRFGCTTREFIEHLRAAVRMAARL